MSLKTLWQKIETFVEGVKVEVSKLFVDLFGQQAATQFATASLALLKTAAGKIVVDAVQAVETLSPTADSNTKRAQAFAQITADMKTQGITVGESEINMLIELAVATLKNDFSVLTSASAASPASS